MEYVFSPRSKIYQPILPILISISVIHSPSPHSSLFLIFPFPYFFSSSVLYPLAAAFGEETLRRCFGGGPRLEGGIGSCYQIILVGRSLLLPFRTTTSYLPPSVCNINVSGSSRILYYSRLTKPSSAIISSVMLFRRLDLGSESKVEG